MGDTNLGRNMSGQDFSVLREEINERFSACMSLNNTVLVVTGAFWLLIFTNVFADSVYSMSLLLLTMIVIWIACAVYTENTNQISVIASYIMIFHEYPSIINNKKELICWEFSQIKTSMLAGKNLRKKLFQWVYYGTYFCLAITNVIIYMYAHINKGANLLIFIIILAIMLFALMQVAIMTKSNIHLFDKEQRKAKLSTFIKIAKNMGLIDSDADEDGIINLFFAEEYERILSKLRGNDAE